MARSLSSAKVLAASLSDGFSSFFAVRRGYAATSQGAVLASFGAVVGVTRVTGKVEGRSGIKEKSEAYTAWAPDPITGYYRPANSPPEIDPAELREMLLNHRVRSH